jgi:hypothetical protein
VEGVRDALLERGEIIGDEIEALMAELGEREPFGYPFAILARNGHGNGDHPNGSGNGHAALPAGVGSGEDDDGADADDTTPSSPA